MRIVRYDRFQGIDQLSVADTPDPQVTPGHVLVRILASCINPGSIAGLGGAFVPARDLAGEVVAVGQDVQDFGIGDAVLGWLQDWAAHAQLVLVPATQLISKPAGLSWDVAGSLYVTPMAGLASVQAVAPQPGELVVVSGASGGVGLAAAQLAQRAGATVIGLTSADNADWVREHSVIPVEYGDGQDDRIRAAADGQPVEAFMDAVGAGYIDLALALGVSKQRINTVVDYRGAKEKGVKALGTVNAGGTVGLRDLADLAASGGLDIPIAGTYPLDQVQDAYRRLAEHPRGRVVLHPQE